MRRARVDAHQGSRVTRATAGDCRAGQGVPRERGDQVQTHQQYSLEHRVGADKSELFITGLEPFTLCEVTKFI